MSEPIAASGGPKQRISYADFKAEQERADALWMEAFAKIEAMGVGAKLGDWKITMLGGGIHPCWVQVKRKKETQMIRRGEKEIHDLARFCANSNDRFSTKENQK